MQHTTLPRHFSNTDMLLTRAQEHLAPALHQHRGAIWLHRCWCQFRSSRMMNILQKQADVWYSQAWDELPQITPSKSTPKLQGANNLMRRISKWFCFVSNTLCLPPALASEASQYCETQKSWVKHSTCPAAGTQPCCQLLLLSRAGYHFQKGLE